MMRILHLLGATEDTGGILTVLRNLQAATAARGCEHVVWVNHAYREVRRPALQYRQTRHLLQDSYNHPQLAWRAWRSLAGLRALLRSERFDVLHAHTRGAFLVALALATAGRRTVVFTNHGYARRRGLYRWGASRPRLLTCVLTPNMARHYGLRLGSPNLFVVSECCADSFLERELAPRAPPTADGRIRLAGLGNIVAWKNWHLVIEALARLPEPERRRLVFEHWGPRPSGPECAAYDARLQELVAQRGAADACRFHGLSLAVEESLRGTHWFVLPSTNEPCSVALIEALALGLPALVSASGGNVDVVRDGVTGLLFDPGSVTSLAACLGRIARGEVAMASPVAIRESVRSRSASAVAEDYLRVYQRAISGAGPGSEG
jgi:glycosyltransferase involved in cell wall biosynthesis